MNEQLHVRLSSGIAGLDEILHGGFLSKLTYLVRGGPGSGKTTLGLHFLMASAANGDKALFISLEEAVENVQQTAMARGLDLSGIDFLDLSPTSDFFRDMLTYDIFSPAEVERDPTTQRIIEQVEAIQPTCVFLDPLTQFRYFASDVFQFRRQVLSFLRFLIEKGATVLFTSESSADAPDDDLQYMSDGIINLEHSLDGRTVHISKFRGSAFRTERHTYKLTESGMVVYPRLLPEVHKKEFTTDIIPSGVAELDQLLHGGLERGTITIISGPTGVGKTSLGLQFMKEAAERGERSIVYTFEEEVNLILKRCEATQTPAQAMIEKGTLSLVKIEPLQFGADEFANLVRHDVEEHGTRLVMLDSIAGYRLSVRGDDLVPHLHALCKYLQNMGVVVLLVSESRNIIGTFQATDDNISYLADNVVFLRYLEMHGEMRKAIGVLKKRLSDFQKTLREFQITSQGIKVGRPLNDLRGILLGTPEWVAKEKGEELR